MPDFKLSDTILNLTIRDVISMDRVTPDLNWLLKPYIKGMEVTQAIQFYNADEHLTDSNDRGANNSARLVAYKPAWVRVYLGTLLFSQIPDLTGELVISRSSGPFNSFWATVATLSPLPPGTATAIKNINYVAERGFLNSSLNFVIPADDMFGYLRLEVRIRRQGENQPIATYTEEINATLLQTLRLRGIFISYNGQNAAGTTTLNLPAPTLADLQNTAAYTLTVDPVQSTGSFSSAGSLTWSTPLTGVATAPGGCSMQWLNLNAAVAQVKTNDGNRNDLIYYGLLPNGVPIANVGGCESSGVSTGPNGAQVTMAHEVGHGAGLSHGPCGTSSGDPNYPAYEPYDTPANRISSIGEYGLNINTGAILNPANNDDYMSYCNQNWISLYHHQKLINVQRFKPKTVGISTWEPPELVDPWLWPWEILVPGPIEEPWNRRFLRAEPLISIIGIMHEEGKVEVLSVMRVMALPQIENAVETNFTARLVNSNAADISKSIVMKLDSHGCGCGKAKDKDCGCSDKEHESRGPFVFQALLADVEDGAKLSIAKSKEGADSTRGAGVEEVWSRQAPASKPQILRFEVKVREDEGFARWEMGESRQDDIDFSMQFSKDEGRSWNSLGVGIKGREFKFDLAGLPSGEVIFGLLAHDGFHTTKFISKPVKLPRKAPIVSIMHPLNGSVFFEGQPLRLWGCITSDTVQRTDRKRCRWMIDGNEVQVGIDGWVTAPSAGEHKCTLAVDDEAGVAEVTVKFVTQRSRQDGDI
jgi:hypothetical protein